MSYITSGGWGNDFENFKSIPASWTTNTFFWLNRYGDLKSKYNLDAISGNGISIPRKWSEFSFGSVVPLGKFRITQFANKSYLSNDYIKAYNLQGKFRVANNKTIMSVTLTGGSRQYRNKIDLINRAANALIYQKNRGRLNGSQYNLSNSISYSMPSIVNNIL